MIDLMDGGIQHSNLFTHMPLFDEIYYEGYIEGKVRRYKAIREGETCKIIVLNFIRKDEDVVWNSLQDVIKGAVRDATFSVHGVYTFDLLTMDVHKEIQAFRPHELTQMFVNHSQKLNPGDVRLVKYSTVYGLMQKMIHEDWGKIKLQTSVEVFKDDPKFLDLMFKQLLKNFAYTHDPAILLLNDLSLNPVFDLENSLQQERITKVLQKQISSSIEFPPEVYVQDKNGVHELCVGLPF